MWIGWRVKENQAKPYKCGICAAEIVRKSLMQIVKWVFPSSIRSDSPHQTISYPPDLKQQTDFSSFGLFCSISLRGESWYKQEGSVGLT